jgi:hypothetical protein
MYATQIAVVQKRMLILISNCFGRWGKAFLQG